MRENKGDQHQTIEEENAPLASVVKIHLLRKLIRIRRVKITSGLIFTRDDEPALHKALFK